MEYNAKFIDELLASFHSSFLDDYEDWCKIARYEPSGNHYMSKMFQGLYALRYFPAYYLEYCILADLLREKVESDYEYLNIYSFGCGLAPDYYAFRDNLRDIAFDYHGYDHFSWSTQKLMPLPDVNFSFTNDTILNLKVSDIEDVDVFVFPKSIGDIAASDVNAMSEIAKLIASTSKERIFFLNSFVSSGNGYKISSDVRFFKYVHDALIESGFSTNEQWDQTYCWGGTPEDGSVGLRKIHYDFCYPDKYMIECGRKEDVTLCNGCNVVKKPILSNRFIDYQIMEYSR
ncbi:hypothetical protein [Pseudomonas protegens]|uniref:hypothetical protein n=1 Tax=Pseudomonas protegens TaxID=380021 RepID=UPI0010721DB8|nr:hypothetical protein [Pseudomonas protegens]